MLETLATAVKLFLVPGSLSFLLAGLTAGVLLARGSGMMKRVALAELAALTALYWILSLPVVADGLASRFSYSSAERIIGDLQGCDSIVVLGAGIQSLTSNGQTLNVPDPQTALNAFEGARIYHLLAPPVPVVASGGVVGTRRQREPESVVIRDLLVQAGVPPERIVLESHSTTTHEQAINVTELVRQRGWRRIALVTPPVQMPRAVGSFVAQGVSSIVRVEAPFRPDADDKQGFAWLPSMASLWVSERAIYDYIGWMYYGLRGWLG
jgi:uncharacterized SAM-binding protein YcdF (DUF218 family)